MNKMNTIKKLAVAAFVAMVGLCSSLWAATAESDFTFDSTTGTITGYSGAGGDVEIPATIGGVDVTAIGDQVFHEESALTSVTIPAGVTNIGNSAFSKDSNLTNVTFASGSQLKGIGQFAFGNCSFTSITIPAGVTSIGQKGFDGCRSLVNVTFASGSQLKSIGVQAFAQCTDLTEITIPSSVTNIGMAAFGACSKLEEVTVLATEPPMAGDMLFSATGGADPIATLTAIKVPAESVDKYKDPATGNGWETYADLITASTTAPAAMIVTNGGATTNFYDSVQAAFDSEFTANQSVTNTVTLLRDYTETAEQVREVVGGFKGTLLFGLFDQNDVPRTARLDLNGYTLTGGSGNFVSDNPEILADFMRVEALAVGMNSVLIIDDSSEGKTGAIRRPAAVNAHRYGDNTYKIYVSIPTLGVIKGDLTLAGGTIYGQPVTNASGRASILGVVNQTGRFTMTGGEIKDCSVDNALIAAGILTVSGATSISGGKVKDAVVAQSATMSISGGFFGTEDVKNNSTWLADGARCRENDDEATLAEGYGWKVTLPVAMIVTDDGATTNLYYSVQEAFDSDFTADPAVTNTVTLLRDYTEVGTKTITAPGVPTTVLSSAVLGDFPVFEVSDKGPRTVRLDLNGKTFVGGASENVVLPAVFVGSGSVLVIDDSDPEKKGVIARPRAVTQSSILNLADAGPALAATIATFGQLTLCDGKIKGEEAFTEYGQSVAIGIFALESSHFTMTGGVVENAEAAGGEFLLSAGVMAEPATFSMTGGKIKDKIINMGSAISISGGLFGTEDVRDNESDWLVEGATCDENTDPVTRAEGYSWKVTPPAAEGSPENPWKIGVEGSEGTVQAYTNGNGGLVITGTGAMKDFPSNRGGPWDVGITSVTISEGVTSIGGWAFRSRNNLTSVTIPASVTSIAERAFAGCGMESVIFAEGSQLKAIGRNAFEQCLMLSSMTIPAGVTNISEYVFYTCPKLASVTFAEGCQLKTIDECAFIACGLTDVTIPEGVTDIGETAFGACKSLMSVTIPASVTNIGTGAFAMCDVLAEVTVLATEPPTVGQEDDVGLFHQSTALTTIKVPVGTVEAYKSADGWSTYAAMITDGTVPTVETTYYAWNETKKAIDGPYPTNAIPVTADMTTLGSGWYVVTNDVTMTDHCLIVNGDAHLILADGAELVVLGEEYCAGIEVEVVGSVTNSLTIYGQAESTGKLLAKGGSYRAGIGCSSHSQPSIAAGTITINGGQVTAEGGFCAAGIGGGGNGGVGGTVTINGGKVLAVSCEQIEDNVLGQGGGAGIGGGAMCAGGTVTVNGGEVTAISYPVNLSVPPYYAEGIGMGAMADVPGTFTLGAGLQVLAGMNTDGSDAVEVAAANFLDHDDVIGWHTNCYVKIMVVEGSARNPWKVGVEGSEETVQAYTNGAGKVFVKGTGTPKPFAAGAEPWAGAEPAIDEIVVLAGRSGEFEEAWPGYAGKISELPNYLNITAVDGQMTVRLARCVEERITGYESEGVPALDDPGLEYAFDPFGPWSDFAIGAEVDETSGFGEIDATESVNLEDGETIYVRRKSETPILSFNGVKIENLSLMAWNADYWMFDIRSKERSYDEEPLALAEVHGNVMSLLDRTCASHEVGVAAFYALFNYCDIATAPELPATDLADLCYYTMFTSCAYLREMPALSVKRVPHFGYFQMFARCFGLETAVPLGVEECGINSCHGMFMECSSLTNAPSLVAVNKLDSGCFGPMFFGCSSLKTAPELPTVELAEYCYVNMFASSGITNAPALPATTLAMECCRGMFYGCADLLAAPKLPAANLELKCYQDMMAECPHIDRMEVGFKAWREAEIIERGSGEDAWEEEVDSATATWLYNVAETGTFVAPPELPVIKDEEGSHIPLNWNVTKRFTLPTGTLSGGYVVSNVTDEATQVEPVVSQMGGNVYEIPVRDENETIEVYVKPGPGYIVQGENPLRVNLYEGTTDDFRESLPKAVLPVAMIVTGNGATTNLYASVQEAFDSEFTDNPAVTNTVTLLRDYTETAEWEHNGIGPVKGATILGAAGFDNSRTARLDLNGFTLTGGRSSADQAALIVTLFVGPGSVLIIDDSSEAKTGAIRKPGPANHAMLLAAVKAGQLGANNNIFLMLPTVSAMNSDLTLAGGTIYGVPTSLENAANIVGVACNAGRFLMTGGEVVDVQPPQGVEVLNTFGVLMSNTSFTMTDGKVKDPFLVQGESTVSISGGLFGTEDVKNNPDWIAEGYVVAVNTDEATLSEGYNWKVVLPAPGSPANPWDIAAPESEGTVTAYTNGTGTVIIEGTGTPKTFAAGEEPWAGAVPAIDEIVVPTGRVDEFVKKWPWLAKLFTDGTAQLIDATEFTVTRNEDGTFLVRPITPVSGSEWLLATFSAETANAVVSESGDLALTLSESEMVALGQLVGLDRRADEADVALSDLELKGATVACPATLENGCFALPAGTEFVVLMRVNKIGDNLCRVTSVGGVKGLSQLIAGEAVANQAGLPVLIASGCGMTGCNRAEGTLDVRLAAVGDAGAPFDCSVVFHLTAGSAIRSEVRAYDAVFAAGESLREGNVTLDFPEIKDSGDAPVSVTARIEGRQPTPASVAAKLFGDTEEAAAAAVKAWLADPNAETYDGWVESATATNATLEVGSDAMLRFNKDLAHVLAALVKSALVYDNPELHSHSSIDMVKCNLRSDTLIMSLADLLEEDGLRQGSAVDKLIWFCEELKRAGEDEGSNYLAELRSAIKNGTLPKGPRELLDRYYKMMGYGEPERALALRLFDAWLENPANDEWNFEKLYLGDFYGLSEDEIQAKIATATVEDQYSLINSAFCAFWMTFDSAASCGIRETFQSALRSDVLFNNLADMIEVVQGGKKADIIETLISLRFGLLDEFVRYIEGEGATELVAKQFARLRAAERDRLRLQVRTDAVGFWLADPTAETATGWKESVTRKLDAAAESGDAAVMKRTCLDVAQVTRALVDRAMALESIDRLRMFNDNEYLALPLRMVAESENGAAGCEAVKEMVVPFLEKLDEEKDYAKLRAGVVLGKSISIRERFANLYNQADPLGEDDRNNLLEQFATWIGDTSLDNQLPECLVAEEMGDVLKLIEEMQAASGGALPIFALCNKKIASLWMTVDSLIGCGKTEEAQTLMRECGSDLVDMLEAIRNLDYLKCVSLTAKLSDTTRAFFEDNELTWNDELSAQYAALRSMERQQSNAGTYFVDTPIECVDALFTSTLAAEVAALNGETVDEVRFALAAWLADTSIDTEGPNAWIDSLLEVPEYDMTKPKDRRQALDILYVLAGISDALRQSGDPVVIANLDKNDFFTMIFGSLAQDWQNPTELSAGKFIRKIGPLMYEAAPFYDIYEAHSEITDNAKLFALVRQIMRTHAAAQVRQTLEPAAMIVTESGATTNFYFSVQEAFDSELLADQSVTNTVTLLRDYTETAKWDMPGTGVDGVLVFGDEGLDLLDDEGTYVPKHGTRTARLDLNGRTLTGGCAFGEELAPAILVGSGSVLIVDDSSEAKTGVVQKPAPSGEGGVALVPMATIANFGKLELRDCVVRGSKCVSEHLSGALGVLNFGDFAMTGGTIRDCFDVNVEICAGLFNVGNAVVSGGKIADSILNEIEDMKGNISISGGYFGKDDVKDNESEWLAEGCVCDVNTDAATPAEGYKWKVFFDQSQAALAEIFDTANTPTTVEPAYDASGALVGHKVTLGKDYGPLTLPADLGAVTIDLNGWSIKGVDGSDGTSTTPGTSGGPAIVIDGESGANLGATAISVTTVPWGEYMVVDLTEDANGKYPVSYEKVYSYDEFVAKYNADEYKTTKLVFRRVPAGEYACQPGYVVDYPEEFGGGIWEKKTVNKPYYIGVFQITKAQYARVMGLADSSDMTPQNAVSFNDIRQNGSYASPTAQVSEGSFMGRLATKTGLNLGDFDLPTEVRWEIAARANSMGEYGQYLSFGGNVMEGNWTCVGEYGWYVAGSVGTDLFTHDVGLKHPNPWGLYDMIGNVWEWCLDAADAYSWANAETVYGSASSDARTIRGGSFASEYYDCRPSLRYGASLSATEVTFGFRVCCVVPADVDAARPASGETGALVGGRGGDGAPAGSGSEAIVDASGARIEVEDSIGIVARGADGVSFGSEGWPWSVGMHGGEPHAFTNGLGRLVVEGEGTVVEKPWEEFKDGLVGITIKDADVELSADIFEGMGSDDEPVELELPNGWTGDLPGEGGGWHGAKAKIANWPLMIRNVRFQQRYPWNGIVDITADVYGPVTNMNLGVSAVNGHEQLNVEALDGDTSVELTNGRSEVHIVWNAAADLGMRFRSTDIAVGVSMGDDPQSWEKTIWEGDYPIEEFNTALQDLAGEGYDWSQVEVGSRLKAYVSVIEYGGYSMFRFCSGEWTSLPGWKAMPGANPDDGNVDLDPSVSEVEMVLTEDDLMELVYNGGLVIFGAYFDVHEVTLTPPGEPILLNVAAFSEAGRIDLRRPIVVAPCDNDEITYSQTDWGNASEGLSFNLKFRRFLEETPILSTNLTGEGLMDFTYPEQTGRYEFSYRVYAGGLKASAQASEHAVFVNPEVIVAWQIGEGDHPENVYAYDRGDGVVVIAGEGVMKDFDGCGPWGTGITGVIIENGVRNVGANAFKGCTALAHVDLPASMEFLGNGAFAGDTALETIWCNAWYPPWFNRDPFKGVEKENVVVYVPDEVLEDYEYDSEDWAPFWNRSQPEGDEFYFEVYSYEGVSRKVTVNGEVRYEGTEYRDGSIPYGSKVEVTATITDDACLFDDGTTVKTFTWNFWNHGASIEHEIAPYGADWLALQRALAGTPLADSRGAIDYENVDGTNVVKLSRNVSTASQYDRTLVVTNAAVLDLAGHAVIYGNGYASVIGVGASYWEPVPAQQQQQQRLAEKGLQEVGQIAWEEDVAYHDERRYLPAWLNIVDTVGGGRITKSSGSDKLANAGFSQAPLAQQYLGGGVSVLPESVCIMDGGVITSCYGDSAGGVYNAGTFVLTGGEIIGNVAEYDFACDGIVNESGAELIITGGKVRDGIYNVEDNSLPSHQEIAVLDDKIAEMRKLEDNAHPTYGWNEPVMEYVAPVVEISGGYFGANVALDRAWIVEGYEAIPSDEFAGYDKQVIQTPPEVAEARAKAKEEIEKKAGLDMTRSDEMDALVEEALEAIDTAYPKESVETTFAEYLPKVVDQYAKDNPGVPRTLAATGTLDLRSRRELPNGVDVVDGITYSDTAWGAEWVPGDVAILQQNLETGKKMTLAEGVRGASEGTEVQLVGQDTTETGLGHKLFHSVRGTVLESFVTFFFRGFERGKPSNPWEAGEPNVVVYIDPETPTGPTLVIDGEGELYPNGSDVAWNDRREEITEIFVASGIVLRASALAGYPNLQRIVFEDPDYRLPNVAMNDYYDYDRDEWIGMTWPSDGVYVCQFNGRRKVTMFYDETGDRQRYLVDAWNYGFNPIVFSTVPSDLINVFPWDTEFEPLTDELGNLQGWLVTLQNDINGTVYLPDNLGWVVVDLNGHDVRGRDGHYDAWEEELRHGRPAFAIEHDYDEGGEPLVLEFLDSDPDDTPDVVGGKGLDGNPAGNGAVAIEVSEDVREGVKVIVGPNATVKGGDAGTGLGSGVSSGEPAAYGYPTGLFEAIEGGKLENGDEAEYGVTAWATCSLDAMPPTDWLKHLPQGLSYVNGKFWFWRRVGGKTGPATFDFNELPLALIASAGITGADIKFANATIDVDTIKAPVNFGFRFIGTKGKTPKPKKAGENTAVIVGGTMLRSVTGKSIFELAGEYETEEPGQPSIIVNPGHLDPLGPSIVIRETAIASSEASAPALDQAPALADADAAAAEPVVEWRDITFTSGEASASVAAGRWGGAIRMEGGAMRVVGCTFTGCFADDYGGAIFAFGMERDSSVVSSVFRNCFVSRGYGYGGAIYASAKVLGHAEEGANVRFAVSGSTFEDNVAEAGGAICTMRDANAGDLVNEQPVELVVDCAEFFWNVAVGDGGAVFAEGPVTVVGFEETGTRAVAKGEIVVDRTEFRENLAGGSGGAIAMDCAVGDWFVPAKLSVGANVLFGGNVASNAYTYALGGAIAHLQPGGALEVFGARFLDNAAIATGFNAGQAYALGGAVYADADATVSLEKTRFFGNWAVSDNSFAYGGAGSFAAGAAKVTACSFDDNGVAAPDEYYGGALDFAGTDAVVKDSTFRASNVEAVDAYGAKLAFTNCVVVGNATLFGDEGADVSVVDTPLDMAWTAYGSYDVDGETSGAFDDEANHNLPESTVEIYDPDPMAEPWLNPEGYVKAAALGLVQDATDVDGVAYGSKFWGYSMGAYECHTHREMTEGIVVTVDPEEYAYTGLPIEPHSPVRVYDEIVGSNLVEGVDYTLTWANNVEPTDRAVVTAVGTERDYIFSAGTNFWITAYYVDYYKDDADEPYETQVLGSLSHSNVVATIAPPEGYAYDPLTSTPEGEVRRYDGDCEFPRNGQLTLVVHYREDEGGDDVPDVYQKKMHLKVVNGWWNEELNGADKAYWVTLYGEDGKWSREGEGVLGENPTNRAETVALATAGERPFTDYAASGFWWYPESVLATPAGFRVTSASWPYVLFVYDRKTESAGGRTGRGGRGGTGGTSALEAYKLRANLKITKFSYAGGNASGEARAAVVDEATGETLVDELLRRTKVDVLATESLDGGEWSVIGSPTTDGEGGWNAGEGASSETPAQMFYKLQLR